MAVGWSAAGIGLTLVAACGVSTPPPAPTSVNLPADNPGTPAPAAGLTAVATLVAGLGRTIRIGYVSPQTGPLANFGEADRFVIDSMHEILGAGLAIDGISHPLEILVRDSQSDSSSSAQMAVDLIQNQHVDLMLVASTPDTTNPVADQCEQLGVPCLSTVAPWQPYFFGRNGDPSRGFQWTYHFFWGLEDIVAVFLDMWGQVPTNRVVGGIWPNDLDGNAWGDLAHGFPPALQGAGYAVTDPGRYPNLSDDFSSQITTFANARADILTGVPIPPDFTTFWKQAVQRNFHPRIATIGKAILFPSAVEALGEAGDGLSMEVWWSPTHPFTSSLTGQSAAELAASYTDVTAKQWTQPLGFVHALFEVAVSALKRAGPPGDKRALAAALKASQLNTIVGPLDWSTGPVPNVAKSPLAGGQWGRGRKFPYEITIVSNSIAPNIAPGGRLRPLPKPAS